MRRSNNCIRICALFIGLTLSCSANHTHSSARGETDEGNPVVEKEAVYQVIKKYEAALNSRSVDSIMSLFIADAVVLPEGLAATMGKNEIQETYSSILSVYSNFNIDIDVQQIDLFGNGAIAWTVNSGAGTTAENGEEVTIQSKSLLFLKKNADGNWSIYQYMFNRSGE